MIALTTRLRRRPTFLVPFVCLAALTSCATTSRYAAADDSYRRNVSLILGRKDLSESEFPGVDNPILVGLELDWYRPQAPLGFEVSLQHFRDDDDRFLGEFTSNTTELSAGIRKTFELERVPLNLYIGTGLSVFYTRKKLDVPDLRTTDSDLDSGTYARIGGYFRPLDGFLIGLDYRFTWDEPLDYGGFDLDGHQMSLRFGWSF